MQTQNTPYIFISYAHANSDIVLPIVQTMQAEGINLWYDNGIEAGSEWPEFIAEKVMNCTRFVLFMSRAYQDSQNCKRELNFAISRKKEILSIFLEDVMLSPGVEMQLGTYQSILRNRFADNDSFRNSIAKEAFFNVCRTGGQTQETPVQAAPQPQGYHGSYSAPQGYHGSYFAPQSHTYYNPQTNPGGYYTLQTNPGGNANLIQLPLKNRYVAALLAIFLGGLGFHKFYLKKPILGILYIVFCWTYIPAIIGFVEGIVMLLQNDSAFAKKYNCRTQ